MQRFHRHQIIFLLAAMLPTLVPARAATAAEPQKHALLVGVSALQHTPENSLQGPKNDIPALRKLLIEKYGFRPENIETLEDTKPTRAGIVQAFERRLIAPVRAGDLAVFYFSGHGVQVDDTNGDEDDKMDEALVPYDAHSVETVLVDDDLNALAKRIPTREAIVIIDACHSGTGTRGAARAKRLLPQALGIRTKNGTRGGDALPPSTDTLGGDLIGPTVLSAAAASETASDFPFLTGDNPYHGALTFHLLRLMQNGGQQHPSYEALFQQVRAALLQDGFEQTPQLEGYVQKAYLSLPGEKPAPSPAAVPGAAPSDAPAAPRNAARVTAVQGDVVTLEALGSTRFVPGSIFESVAARDLKLVNARPAAPKDPAAVRVTSVRGQTATAQRLRGKADTGQQLAETFHFVASLKLRVAVLGPAAREVAGQVAALDFVQVVPETEARHADLETAKGDGNAALRITPFRNQQKLPEITAGDTAAAMPALRRVLENLYAVKLLSDLENPNAPFSVDVQVNNKDADEARIGSEITFTARVSRDAYLYLVDVDPAGKVTVLFPNKHAPDNRLMAGQVYPMPAPNLYRLRVAGPGGPEIVKAIATEKPLRLDILTGDKGDFSGLGDDAARIARALVEQLKREINKSRSRGIDVLPATAAAQEQPVATGGWAADTVLLRIRE